MPRLLVALALVLAAVACNPKSLKYGYCNVDADCPSRMCNLETRQCSTNDGSVDKAEVGDAPEAGEVGDAGVGDAVDGRDGSDVREVGPPRCTATSCFDGGYDGSAGVCELEAGICVQCLDSSHCAGTTPICDARLCRACKTDAECPDPTICMTDGHCATSTEVVFVEFNANGCPGANGMSASPFCTPNEGVAKLVSGQNVLVIRGATAERMTLNTSGVSPVIIGKNSASIPATAATAVQVLSDSVFIRDVVVNGGTATGSKGIVASGSTTTLKLSNVQANLGTGLGIQGDSGAQLTMDRCLVNGNSVGGLLINGASYSIQNSAFVGNGYGIKFGAAVTPRTSQFSYSTVVGNTGNALTCDSSNVQTLTDSIVVGVVDSCTTLNSVVTAPAQLSGYRLTAHLGCPSASIASPPDHDIDGQPRAAPIDCGADQFQ